MGRGMPERRRFRDEAAQEGDAFDHLGNALEAEKKEADRDEQPGGPAQQPAGIAGNLMPHVGFDEDRPGQPHDDERHRQQEEEAAEKVDPRLRPPRQPAGDRCTQAHSIRIRRGLGAHS